jgi:hypothetical protein
MDPQQHSGAMTDILHLVQGVDQNQTASPLRPEQPEQLSRFKAWTSSLKKHGHSMFIRAKNTFWGEEDPVVRQVRTSIKDHHVRHRPHGHLRRRPSLIIRDKERGTTDTATGVILALHAAPALHRGCAGVKESTDEDSRANRDGGTHPSHTSK